MPSPEQKQNFSLLRNRILAEDGKQYWRSVEEFADTPEFKEFVAREYPHEIEEWDDSLSRRNFVKVMGASLALAGLSGCVIQPSEKIVPFVKNPEGLLPGKPNYYATAMSLGGVAVGLLAKSFDGRPVKVEGNPGHPGSQGATDVLAQASILGMYDPDRSQEIVYRGNPKTWEAFMNELRSAIEENRKDGGAGIRFLTETVTSPTLIDQMTRLKAELPNSKWVQYEPINADNAMAGAKMAFGSPAQAIYRFDKAERILSLDCDLFSSFNVGWIKDYAKRRNYTEENKDISRLYCVETGVSITGAKADHRLAVKPSQMVAVAKTIGQGLGVADSDMSASPEQLRWLAPMVQDLLANKGKSLVVVGDNQPPIVHALAHAMNAKLGNVGQTVVYAEPFSPNSDKLQIDQLRELVHEIDTGQVKLLVILGGNPTYNTPIDLKLDAERMNKVPMRVHLGQYLDETAVLCHWHVSEKHFLESWGDGRAADGTATLVQPLIKPLYDSKSVYEVVQLFFREGFDKSDHDIVKGYWQGRITSAAATPAAQPPVPPKERFGAHTVSEAQTLETKATPAPAATPAAANGSGASAEDRWRKALHEGFVPNTAATARPTTVSTAFLGQPQQERMAGGELEITIRRDPNMYDGRFANNGWLQEMPKPLNKITWDNVAFVSPRTAQRLNLNQGNDPDEYSGGERPAAFINSHGTNMYSDLVTLTYEGGKVNKPVPIWIMPAHPDDVVTIFMGYGRERAGRVGTHIGYNAFDVRRSDAMDRGFGTIAKTGEQTTVVSTQIHFNMEGRDLLRVWDLEEFEKNPKMGHQHNEYDKSMYPYEQHQAVYEKNHKWGMTIDLNSCVGCNACVLACQSENNIPVVGKEQVGRHRMMHWLRVDAYYAGEMESAEGPAFQPVLCQQCEQAPCEVVCPVHATVHSAEGLNDMVYNRCVGTRYCSNNCPYKVRRFNFLLYQDWNTPQYKLMRNPEVSIRSRGVMEKCTYCTQRISAARIEAEREGRPIQDGEVLTACQAVCPTDAIVFGDMHDKKSMVAKIKQDHRNYTLLNELNTQPRTTYLAGLKNQNKEMPDYRQLTDKGHGSEEEPKSGEKKTEGTAGH